MSEDQHSPDRLADLAERLTYLELAVREQLSRLYAIEQRLGIGPPPPAVPVLPPPPPASVPAEVVEMPAAVPVMRADLEAQIGGNWFNRIGVVTIILGVGFFLKYAFDNDWIGPRGRVAAGALLGAAFLGAGEWLRGRGYRYYAQGLSGGGVALLYLSIYAAFAFYQLVGQPAAFAAMALVTIGAALLASRQDALGLAVLGTLGGFLTPLLLSTGVDNQRGLFTYILLLDLGVLALGAVKHWSSLNYLAFAGTSAITTLWIDQWYRPEKLALTIFFLTLFFLLFAALAASSIRREPAHRLDLVLIVANATFYFAASYGLLEARYPLLRGVFTLAVGAFHFALARLTKAREGAGSSRAAAFDGVAAFFLTLAIPIQFDRYAVTMLLAAESVLLLWLGLRAPNVLLRMGAGAIILIALAHWVLIDASHFAGLINGGMAFTPIFNRRAMACAALVAALGLMTWLYERRREAAYEREREWASTGLEASAHLLALLGLSAEAYDYFAAERGSLSQPPTESEAVRRRDLKLTQQLALSVIWTLYSAGLFLLGLWRGRRRLRLFALGLFALTIAKVFLIDLSTLDRAYRIVSFILLGAILLLVSFLYQRRTRRAEIRGG